MEVLKTEQDFYELAIAFLERAHKDNIRHIEPFFDPQGHTSRGIPFETIVNGLSRAFDEGKLKYGITCLPIMCFLRDKSEEDAIKTFEQSLKFRDFFVGVGLDSNETGNPPSKFKNIFERIGKEGFKRCAHAAEEGPASNITEALDLLHVDRIDHGVNCIQDEEVVARLVQNQVPLTVCPVSNVRLKGVSSMSAHPIKKILEKGVMVTVNSDDPSYFGGYLTQNFIEIYKELKLSKEQIFQIGRNNILASWLEQKQKQLLLAEFEAHVAKYS